jgi:hypothetical protein
MHDHTKYNDPPRSAAGSTKPSLSALTAAALALPGFAQAQIQTDYMYARYAEADLARDKVAGDTRERYEIDTHLFRVAAPVGDQAVVASFTYETLSGASPWWVQPDADGRPVQIMSGASIREERADVQLTWALPLAGIDWGLSVGYSKEDDYEATNGGVEFEYTPEGASYTVTGGIGYSYDRLTPTVGASSTDVIRKADKDSFSAYGGVSWILNAQTVLQTALSYGLHDGYLSDPYKRAFIVDAADTVRDSRPGERHQFSASAKLRHYLPQFAAALHADYRYYVDDWEIEAHTLELAWHQILGDSWRITPGLRWYSQSQADFYAPFYQTRRGDGLAASDYRLSPYGAIALRLDARKALPQDWEIGAGIEWYEASGDYAIGSVRVENPGLVEYLNFSFRLGKRF